MPPQNSLTLHCVQCKISQTCPRSGSSPTAAPGGKPALCRIVGGYGLTPVDQSSLSEESRARSAKDGPCLSIAEVPTVDPSSGKLYFERTIVFHKSMAHPRSTTSHVADSMLSSSHVRDAPRRTRS